LRVNGLYAQGDFYVPLATSEATLVASYARGARLISACGGCSTALLNDGLSRSPVFAFASILETGLFVDWVLGRFERLKEVAEATTRFGKLIDLRPHVEGNHLYLTCEYTTGDAAGQNMTTIATEALCSHILEHCPVKPEYWFLEGNFSGDKKASAISFVTVRGKKVTAEIAIPAQLLKEHLGADIEKMLDYWRLSALGGVMSGTIGVQGHYANGLTALYLATGQDAACAAESGIGVTRMEIVGECLYASVTLPNVIVGTIGGGTKLPTQAIGLKILGLEGSGKARALAEVAAALCLAGELSLIGAISAGDFARAHRSLARGGR
ncbi:MAG: hydroxymethylglutaryl-CoA reductase, partial [Kiloniellales bacterium]|nr:hydroxymethylglutaryl-CoA reductase [Kiloniellales bacterium]